MHSAHSTPPELPPDVLVILADDLGTDKVAVYAEHDRPPPTPNLDALAARGTLFRNAWATPLCSPTRAALVTGRMPRRTGVGANLQPGSRKELPLAERTLPELLSEAPDPWSTAWIGKWHLSTPTSPSNVHHPNLQGFDHFWGTLTNLYDELQPDAIHDGYYHWDLVDDGQVTKRSDYATSAVVDEAIARMADLPHPWLIVVAMHAAHRPLDEPPTELTPVVLGGPDATVPDQYHAVVEAMDTELGRLLGAVDDDRTLTFFLGDNGTPDFAILPPWNANRGKESMFEGGINVPMLAAGPGVAVGAETPALVHVVDLFATVADLAGVALPDDVDGRSLRGVLADPTAPLRDVLHTERFEPAGPPPYRLDWRASRGPRFKVFERVEDEEIRVYDLEGRVDDGVAIELDALDPSERAEVDALIADHLAYWPTLGGPELR
ncbi:MAG: sulfatase-like hydrolase/transferase [Myxococcales bacterium]|nr:sulfatase-like hydrolase/transferase [Myxococcales bacterium]